MSHSVLTLQNVAGEVRLTESVLGKLPSNFVRVRTHYSGISAGTELLSLAQSAAAGSREPSPLGYQLAGEVVSVGDELGDCFSPGDFAACYGGPYVHHASMVQVPRLLAIKLPPQGELLEYAFCGLGAVALHAFRSSGLRIGETAAVIGLGILGNLVAQIARAAGCRIAALDPLPTRRDIASQTALTVLPGMAELADAVGALTDHQGADAVFVVVGGANDGLIEEAFRLVRFGGKVLIVGTADARIPRELLFQKEAELMVPRAAGPGRYDPDYESGGHDYPYSFVRWTEGRNLAEFVRLVSAGLVQTLPLITDVVTPDSQPHQTLQHSGAEHLGIAIRW